MNGCPEWSGEIPPAKEAGFRHAVRRVYREVATTAAHRIVDDTVPARWHMVLFRDVVPLDYYAGNYRQDDRKRPCLGVSIEIGGVQGSLYQLVPTSMARLFDTVRSALIRTEMEWNSLTPRNRSVRVASVIAHAVGGFVRIHPFINGNGRVSRLLWAWGLLRFGVPIQCRLARRPDPPYSQVMRRVMQGDNGFLALYVLQHLTDYAPDRVV